MNIYVASSWRNKHQPSVVARLRRIAGCVVYDFRNPPHGRGGFAWSEIDPAWEQWTPEQWREALSNPLAREGFQSDYEAMIWADACVLVLPSGRSSHLEAGWFVGKGKPVVVYAPEAVEPDLMVNLCDRLICNVGDLDAWVCDELYKRTRAAYDSAPREPFPQ